MRRRPVVTAPVVDSAEALVALASAMTRVALRCGDEPEPHPWSSRKNQAVSLGLDPAKNVFQLQGVIWQGNAERRLGTPTLFLLNMLKIGH